MKKLFATIGLGLALLGMDVAPALAVVSINSDLHPENAPVVVIAKGNEADYANYFLQLIAGGLLYFAAPVAVLIIAVSGVRYVVSHGDENQIEGAKKTLTWAIIGLVVVIGAWAIVRLVIGLIVAPPQ